jgi:hypothetical protein
MAVYPGKGCVDGFNGDHNLLAAALNIKKSEVEYIVEVYSTVIKRFFKETYIE